MDRSDSNEGGYPQ